MVGGPMQPCRHPVRWVSRLAVSWLLVSQSAGCAHSILLRSEPMAATVTLPDDTVIITPASIEVSWRGVRTFPIRVEKEGYEVLEVDLRRTEGRPLRQLEGVITLPNDREVTFYLQRKTLPFGASPDED